MAPLNPRNQPQNHFIIRVLNGGRYVVACKKVDFIRATASPNAVTCKACLQAMLKLKDL